MTVFPYTGISMASAIVRATVSFWANLLFGRSPVRKEPVRRQKKGREGGLRSASSGMTPIQFDTEDAGWFPAGANAVVLVVSGSLPALPGTW